MICTYCGKDKKGTKEHVISKAVLDLFPECDLTINGETGRVYTGDPMIKDVCQECNQKINYIDSYAKEIINQYFVQDYSYNDELYFCYDYTLLQKMCVKYAYNDCRVNKYNIGFFDDEIIDWLLDKQNYKPNTRITLMGGLAINTSPVPNFLFGNEKLRWVASPLLLSDSLVERIDYYTGELCLNESPKQQELPGKIISYIFRFNSLQIIMICWEKNISDDTLTENNTLLRAQYPYTILGVSGKSVLKRCTSEVTFHQFNIVDVVWGQEVLDEVSYLRGTFSDSYQDYLKEIDMEWKKVEEGIAKAHPRK